jgi:hypothetical protein
VRKFLRGNHDLEHVDVMLQLVLILVEGIKGAGHAIRIGFDLCTKAGFGIVHEMPVVLPLDQAFQRKSDQQADRDGEEMQQEVAPAVRRFVGSVDVDHKAPRHVALQLA